MEKFITKKPLEPTRVKCPLCQEEIEVVPTWGRLAVLRHLQQEHRIIPQIIGYGRGMIRSAFGLM